MAIDFNILASKNYATLINDVNDTAKALVKMALVGDENGLPVGAIRLNSGKFQSWSGSGWVDYKFNTILVDVLKVTGDSQAYITIDNGVLINNGANVINGLTCDTLYTNIISEDSPGVGVAIDGVTLKDGCGIFTGNVGIGTNTPTEKCHISDGNFVNSGIHNSSPTLSISGKGSRMFFYPRKSAFRAGYVDGTQWNDENIGAYSTAMGRDTTASRAYSTAMGYGTKASGYSSTAMGYETTASGSCSIAMGYKTTASGFYSIAMGHRTEARGESSLVGGEYMDDNNISAFMWGRSSVLSTTDYNIKTWRSSNTGTKYGTLKGTWDINGASITSDIRLKKNVKTLGNCLDKIKQINPVSFDWIKPEERHEKDITEEVGVIAQELEKIFPELITHMPAEEKKLIEDGVRKGVKYTGLIPYLIKAIQELSAKIEGIEYAIQN